MFLFRRKPDGKSEYLGYAGGPVRRSKDRVGDQLGKIETDEWAVDRPGGMPYKTGKRKQWGRPS